MDNRPIDEKRSDVGLDELDKDNAEVNHLERVFTNGAAAPEWDQVRADAIKAEEAENSMGLVEGLKTYPRAVFWSFSISLLISESLQKRN